MGGCATKPKVLDKAKGEVEAPMSLDESVVANSVVVDVKEEKEKEKEVVAASSEAEHPGGSHRSLGLLLKESGESIGPPEADEVTLKDTITPPSPVAAPEVEAEEPTKKEDHVVVEHSEPKTPVVEVASVDSTISIQAEKVETVKGEEALQPDADVTKEELPAGS